MSNWIDLAMLVAASVTSLFIGMGVWVVWKQLGLAAAAQERQALAQESQAEAQQKQADAQQQQANAASSQHIKDIFSKWGDERLETARKRVNSYGDSEALCERLKILEKTAETDEYYELTRIPKFFEELGLYALDYETISSEVVRDTFEFAVTYYWSFYEPFIKWIRSEYGTPSLYMWFERLSADMNLERDEG